MKILGLDTSTSSTGYAVLDTDNRKIISYGTIKTTKKLDLNPIIKMRYEKIVRSV